jgi:hypothetical protein
MKGCCFSTCIICPTSFFKLWQFIQEKRIYQFFKFTLCGSLMWHIDPRPNFSACFLAYAFAELLYVRSLVRVSLLPASHSFLGRAPLVKPRTTEELNPRADSGFCSPRKETSTSYPLYKRYLYLYVQYKCVKLRNQSLFRKFIDPSLKTF